MSDLPDRIIRLIDEGLATAPSSDTDYGFGRETERCARKGLCWKCGRRPAADEVHGTALCDPCRYELIDAEGPDPDWTPPEPESRNFAFGRRLERHRCASDGCKCGGLEQRAAVIFAELRELVAPLPRPPRLRRLWRAIKEQW